MSNLKEIHISIEELVFRVAAATRCSMNEKFSANWEGFDIFIFNDSASEESYDDILENYSNH